MNLDQLITRLSEAVGPDRELDCYIHAEVLRAAQPDKESCFTICGPPMYEPQRYFFNPNIEIHWLGYDLLNNAPNYTSSIDAALTLVPEGWAWEQIQFGKLTTGDIVSVSCGNSGVGDNYKWCDGEHACTAIALCIAALRARQSLTP